MSPVLDFSKVSVVRGGNRILDAVNWSILPGERWVILGPNGAGKTTLLQVASAAMHPTSGVAKLLDERLGASDVFELRPRIGLASSSMAKRIPVDETVLDVVLTAAYAVTGALCLGAAACIPGTVAHRIAANEGRGSGVVVIEHPGGALETRMSMTHPGGNNAPVFHRAGIVRTARPLFEGFAHVPSAVWSREREFA
jgi:hypothetical protein